MVVVKAKFYKIADLPDLGEPPYSGFIAIIDDEGTIDEIPWIWVTRASYISLGGQVLKNRFSTEIIEEEK